MEKYNVNFFLSYLNFSYQLTFIIMECFDSDGIFRQMNNIIVYNITIILYIALILVFNISKT